MKMLFLFSFLFMGTISSAQEYVVQNIRSFGAKGDGKTDDHAAFEKASRFFNERGGRGKLLIPKGIYLVGKQVFKGGKEDKAVYEGFDVLYFDKVHDLAIEGEEGAVLRFRNGLRFGAFDSLTGKPVAHPTNSFKGHRNAAFIGNCIYLGNAESVEIRGLELDGNNENFILGGADTDGDRQLAHYGIYIQDSREVVVENVRAHHFGLDGICIANGKHSLPDSLQLLNSEFDYNARQGLSWIGGNDLFVKACHFDNTGQGRFRSLPSAGVDIEAEEGPVSNGRFEECTFINNKKFGLVAHSGDSRDCSFKDCTFWGVDRWALWIMRPNFRFYNSRIYGAFVNGYDATTFEEATRFQGCTFEDKPYQGKKAFGEYLVESNNKRKVSFDSCRFISHYAKLIWVEHQKPVAAEDCYRFTACQMIIQNTNLPAGDYAAHLQGVYLRGCDFYFTGKAARRKGYYINRYNSPNNTDAGGNRIRYAR